MNLPHSDSVLSELGMQILGQAFATQATVHLLLLALVSGELGGAEFNVGAHVRQVSVLFRQMEARIWIRRAARFLPYSDVRFPQCLTRQKGDDLPENEATREMLRRLEVRHRLNGQVSACEEARKLTKVRLSETKSVPSCIPQTYA
jgi:hypothetical protein